MSYLALFWFGFFSSFSPLIGCFLLDASVSQSYKHDRTQREAKKEAAGVPLGRVAD